jgi:hypothetical protein
MSEHQTSVYIEACPLIDMAEHKAGLLPSSDPRSAGVWFCKQALRAARDNKMAVFTSIVSVAECTSCAPGLPQPPDEIKRFYEMLLLSGKSGIRLIQTTRFIATKARDLRWVSAIGLKGVDAIHVASAISQGCDELWTRDGKIWNNRLKIAELGLTIVKPQSTNALPGNYRTMELLPDSE